MWFILLYIYEGSYKILQFLVYFYNFKTSAGIKEWLPRDFSAVVMDRKSIDGAVHHLPVIERLKTVRYKSLFVGFEVLAVVAVKSSIF
jgi:hypothetical protein